MSDTPNLTGLIAVEEAMCKILAARNPGTSWVPSHRAQDPGATLSGCVEVGLLGLVADEADAAEGPG